MPHPPDQIVRMDDGIGLGTMEQRQVTKNYKNRMLWGTTIAHVQHQGEVTGLMLLLNRNYPPFAVKQE